MKIENCFDFVLVEICVSNTYEFIYIYVFGNVGAIENMTEYW